MLYGKCTIGGKLNYVTLEWKTRATRALLGRVLASDEPSGGAPADF